MTAQLDSPTLSEPIDERPATGVATRLVRRMAIAAVIADLALMGIIQQVIPPLAVFAVATVAVLVVFRDRPTPLVASLAGIALLANIGGVPFWSADIQHPADTVAFLWAVMSAGGRFVVVVAAALALWRPDSERAARLVGTAAIGLLALAVVGAVISRATLSDDVVETGDITVPVAALEFPDTITVAEGQALYVDNQDPFRHTFTVSGTDVDVALDPTVARRVPVNLQPGNYPVICTVPGHETMTATLVVTS